jgi:hypothetical protein
MQYHIDYAMKSLADFYTGSAIQNAPKHTGRIPLSDSTEKIGVPPATMYAAEPYMIPARISEQINYRHYNTPLNTLFFSQDNIANLQAKIRNAVLMMSTGAHTIDDQSEPDLKIIMRSYYLQYAENNPDRVAAELDELNNRVIHYCANQIMVEIEAYKAYRKDILDFPEPIANPIGTNVYGSRTGELKSFF